MRIYISSTYGDLVDYRKKVWDALDKMGYDVARMEDYVATDERPVDKCLADVRASDVYVGLFAWRYGYVPPGHDRSITELEYRAASEAGKPRLIFLCAETAPWPRNLIEGGAGGQRLEELRAELATNHVVSFFSNAKELARLVSKAVADLAQQRLDADVAGLRRAQDRRDRGRKRERVVNVPPIEVSRFCGRAAELADLERFVADPGVRVVSVVGRGGMGKTALACRVLADVEKRARATAPARGAARVDGLLYLSARTTGIDLERVYSGVQRMLEPREADRLAAAWAKTDATIAEKVDALLATVRGGHYVVLLDGLDTALGDDGTVVEEGLRAFVEGCVSRAGGPTLVSTSRVDLALPPDALPGARVVRLRAGLPAEEAIALLQSLDPQGELGLQGAAAGELERAVALTGGIPRALEILAGILHRDPSSTLESLLADERALGSQTVEGLVADGYRRLGADDQRVVEAMAVFDRPVPRAAIAFLLHPWLPGLDAAAALRRLTASYFVTASRGRDESSLQRLDREHAYRQIPETGEADVDGAPAWDRARLELRAADFYATLLGPPAAWRSIEDVVPALREFEHRVRGGDVDRALEVLDAVDAEHLFLWGHYTRIIELRRSVLDRPARPALRAANLNSLAACCQVLTQYDAAVGYYEAAVETARAHGDRAAQAKYAGNLGRLHRNLGYIDRTITASEEAVDVAVDHGDRRAEGVWRDRLGLAYGLVGRLDEAAAQHEASAAIAREAGDRRTEGATLSNLGLIRQAQGRAEEAEACFAESFDIAREIKDRRGEAILLGRLGTVAQEAGDHRRASELHGRALAIARELNERREESYQLIGLGRAAADLGDSAEAERHLRAARDLDVPETSYVAALALSLVLLPRDRAAAASAFADTVRRCRDRLQRCERLHGARFALATALAGAAVCDGAWSDERQRRHLLLPALDEYERALGNCRGAGVVRAALRDVGQLTAGGIAGLERAVQLLERALAAAGGPPTTEAAP